MIDIQSLPYIDLGADPEILRKYAKDHFGKVIHPNAKGDTVVARFKEIYLEETGVSLADIDPEATDNDTDDDPDDATKAQQERVPKFVTINIQDDEKDPSPVVGSVNFRAFRIVRNTDVKVSYAIFVALKNAIRDVLNEKGEVVKQVPYYTFSVVDKHYE